MTSEELKTMLDERYPKKDTFEQLVGSIDGIGGKLATLEDSITKIMGPDLSKGETVKAWVDGKEVDAVILKDSEVAELEAKGFLDGIMSAEFMGVPIGQAAVGGFVSIVVSELVDGFFSKWEPWQRGLIKVGGAAFAVSKWGRRVFGSTGGKTIALLLTFDAIRDITPLESWADQIAETISGTETTAGLAGNQVNKRRKATDVGAPSNTTSGYYAAALGGK